MSRRALLLASVAQGLCALTPRVLAQSAVVSPYLERDEVQEFITTVVNNHGLAQHWIERCLQLGRYAPDAERLNTPSLVPPTARNWRDYRARNVDERRIRDGVNFLKTHRTALMQAQEQYGVPPEFVVAIIGIETIFGRLMGNYRVLDVLLTLTFDYTRRAALYREELTQFLLLLHEQQLDPLALRGSFAGAIGMPQFMPSSIRKFAVDFDADAKIDLIRSPKDAIGSVANFLQMHGWQRDQPVQFAAQAQAGVAETLGGGIRAEFRWADVQALGVNIQEELAAETPVLLLDLPYTLPMVVADAPADLREYRLGTTNMSAVLHYNRSYFYGAAVADLAATIKSRAAEFT